jgi:GxxExxY protein
MNTDKEELIYKAESEVIIGCAIEVHNSLGFGFHEKPYENALVVEFGIRNIPCEQQKQFDLIYKDQKVGNYIPDLIVFSKIIIDTKVIPRISDLEVGQMINYLEVTGLRLGYILNFKHQKLEWKRIVC